jgi:predicted transcriptional regulator
MLQLASFGISGLMPKRNQLRVRLEDGQRERLLEIACARGKGERLSDIVRQAIMEFISPEQPDAGGSCFVNVTCQCKRRVAKLAQELNRSQSQVLEACVEGIHDILESERTPLIIYEVQLRRKYHKKEPLEPSAIL